MSLLVLPHLVSFHELEASFRIELLEAMCHHGDTMMQRGKHHILQTHNNTQQHNRTSATRDVRDALDISMRMACGVKHSFQCAVVTMSPPIHAQSAGVHITSSACGKNECGISTPGSCTHTAWHDKGT